MRGGTSRWLWASAAAAFVVIGSTWALAIARYGGPDEPAHIIRAAGAARGDLVGAPVHSLPPGYRAMRVPAPLVSGDPKCYRHSAATTADCAVPSTAHGLRSAATSAGSAPPWYYLLVGVPVRMLSSGRDALDYRLVAVVVNALILGHTVARIRRGRAWLLAALTPPAWFLLGVVGTSGIEVALVTLALVEAVRRFDEPSASLLRVTVPLGMCLLLRPSAVSDIAVVALFVAPTWKRPSPRRQLAEAVGPPALAGLALFCWNRWADVVLSDQRTADHDSFATTLRQSIEHIPRKAHQALGAMGWNEFFAPTVAQIVWVLTLVGAVWWTQRSGRLRWWHLAWAAMGALLPTLVELAVHTEIGQVWQGRYSIPFAIGGVLIAARVHSPRGWTRALVAGSVLTEVVTLWQTLRRYMVGANGSVSLRSASWQPPMNAWLLLIINLTAMTWLAYLVSSDDVPEDVDEEVGGAGVVVDRQLPVRTELEVGEVRNG